MGKKVDGNEKLGSIPSGKVLLRNSGFIMQVTGSYGQLSTEKQHDGSDIIRVIQEAVLEWMDDKE